MQYYDVIGDIHGHATKLVQLLQCMDYKLVEGSYKHDAHMAIFVGDFIDRGNEQRKTLHIVRSMVNAGSALAIMGNHEFNAICYATQTDNKSNYLRKHNDKNKEQHQAFLNEYPLGSPEHHDMISWFKSLPVYLDLDEIRIIHACWHQPSLDVLNNVLNTDKTIPDEVFITASTKEHPHYNTIEATVKGIELALPNKCRIYDKDRNPRYTIRVKWWFKSDPTYRNVALSVPTKYFNDIPDTLIEPKPYIYHGSKPVFVGHYWMEGKPILQSDNVACVDYSAGKDGELVAYRWNGKSKLSNDNFVKFNKESHEEQK